jgi:exoribonuclease-2
MESGNIIEYIDQKKIVISVVLEIKKQRFRLLTEHDKEINIGQSRVLHVSKSKVNISGGRDNIIRQLKEKGSIREALKEKINIEELWDLLKEETNWIDIVEMSEYCFSEEITSDHESAIIRAFFNNRIYFKFNNNEFLPNTEETVDNTLRQLANTKKRALLIEEGSNWLNRVSNQSDPAIPEEMKDIVKILTSYYLYDNLGKEAKEASQILERAGINAGNQLFRLLVSLGVWDIDENLDLVRNGIKKSFSKEVLEKCEGISKEPAEVDLSGRRDLTDIHTITIDGKSTQDFDDALSLEEDGENYILGVHIIDVAMFVLKKDLIDDDAFERVSSIYMPDDKIPMLPPMLSENICSLKEGETRPCISVMVKISRLFEIIDYKIEATVIRVSNRLNYTDVDQMFEEGDKTIVSLHKIGRKFREKRLKTGALQINIPEINVFLNENKEVAIVKTDRESYGRALVAELMIMANWMMGKFLRDNEVPAYFRSQADPKSRLYQGEDDSLFLNCMQRRHLNRAVVSSKPGNHSGLGLDVYVTATSPIRKYYDLVTQRQVKSILGLVEPYTQNEIKKSLYTLQPVMGTVGRLQFMRKKYWMLKHLEQQRGAKEEAIVLEKRRDFYIILLNSYMLECKVSASGTNYKPRDLVSVVIQHADARNDLLSVLIR